MNKNYYDNYLKLLLESGKKNADVARGTELSPTVFSEWKKGKSVPNTEKLFKIAQFFHVSMEYLLTGNDSFVYQVTPLEYQLVLAYRQADNVDKLIIKRTLKIEDTESEPATA